MAIIKIISDQKLQFLGCPIEAVPKAKIHVSSLFTVYTDCALYVQILSYIVPLSYQHVTVLVQ